MSDVLKKIKENVSRVIMGKDDVLDLLLAALAAGGHVLLEDVPGTGKTMMARALAKSMDFKFSRIQFTPDLLPSDVTGISYYNQEQGKFVFRVGPVFTNLLLSDEINRATPRTQSSLLECMAEGQVTVDGVTRKMAQPFFVIATQNPVETLGCFPLPEAQMDRFLMRIYMGNLSAEAERQMVDSYMNAEPLDEISAVCTMDEILALQRDCKNVFVHNDLRNYIISLTRETRQGKNMGVSPRGTLALLRASQGFAMVEGRDYVVPEDIKAVAIPVMVHRMLSEYGGDGQKEEQIIRLLNSVPLPTEDWSRA